MKLLGFIKGIKDPKVFEGKTCILPFSIGQAYHELDKLEASLILAAEYFTPSRCFGVVCDTLQAETIAIGFSSYSETLSASKQKGDEFLARNGDKLNFIGQQNPSWLTRWDSWVYPSHSGYSRKRQYIDELCKQDMNFTVAIDRTARKFLRSIAAKFTQGVPPDAFERCCNYVKNECAVAFLWANELKPNYILYPMEVNDAVTYIIQIIQKSNPDLMQPLQIRFVTKPKTEAPKLLTTMISPPVSIPAQQARYFFDTRPSITDGMEASFLEAEATLKRMKADLLSLKAQYQRAVAEGKLAIAQNLEQKMERRTQGLKDLNIYLSDNSRSDSSSNSSGSSLKQRYLKDRASVAACCSASRM